MKLRKLTKSDYSEMLALYRQLDRLHVEARPDYFVDREDVYPQEHYDAAVTDPECLLMGAFVGEGTLIGIVRATLWMESGMVKNVKTVCLDDIFVSGAYRRRGVATKLFREVEQWARQQGALRLDLHVWEFNQDAMALYRAMGMEPQRHVLEKKL